MKSTRHVKVILPFILLVVLVPLLAAYVASIRGGKTETNDSVHPPLVITDMMTVQEFGQQNNIPNEVLKWSSLCRGSRTCQKRSPDST
jgi:hypothetical protein